MLATLPFRDRHPREFLLMSILLLLALLLLIAAAFNEWASRSPGLTFGPPAAAATTNPDSPLAPRAISILPPERLEPVQPRPLPDLVLRAARLPTPAERPILVPRERRPVRQDPAGDPDLAENAAAAGLTGRAARPQGSDIGFGGPGR